MPMYNSLKYSSSYSVTFESLWNHHRDELNDSANENNHANRINSNKTTTRKSFEYLAKIIGSTPDNDNRLNGEVVGPLKHLSNFWRSLDLPLINCEIELDLSVSRYCVHLKYEEHLQYLLIQMLIQLFLPRQKQKQTNADNKSETNEF